VHEVSREKKPRLEGFELKHALALLAHGSAEPAALAPERHAPQGIGERSAENLLQRGNASERPRLASAIAHR
jgi:hypothetical protein